MGAQRVQMKEWLVSWSRHASTKDFFPALAALASSVLNIFFPHCVHYFNLCVPFAQQPGKAVVQGRLSLNVCLRLSIVPVSVIVILHSCLSAPLPSIVHVVHICTQAEAEFLDVFRTKVLRVFLLANNMQTPPLRWSETGL
jgi:hypothetical protein